jgi:predicted RNase H-like HicB family nuclease
MDAPKTTNSGDLQFLLSRRYPVTLHPAEEGGYVAEVEDLPGCLAQGETIEEVAAAIDECRVAWIEAALADGLKVPPPKTDAAYSGRFLLRLPKSLHRRLAEHARQDGVSLNTETATLLAASLEARDQQHPMKALVGVLLDAGADRNHTTPYV